MRWLPAENELGSEQNGWLDKITREKDNESVVGFPGSGKTVLMVYAVIRLRKLNPKCRVLIVEFTHALIKMLAASIDEVSKEQKYKDLHLEDVGIKTYYDFFYDHTTYDYIICDEVQDVPSKVITAMKDRAKRVIVAGDPNQSIYEKDPRWKECPATQPEVNGILSPESKNLTIIYRLTKSIIKAIDTFMPNMKILAGKTSMIKTNVQIRLWKFDDPEEEVRQIMNEANNRANVNSSVGILLRKHDLIVHFANLALKTAGKPMWSVVKNEYNRNDYKSLNNHLKANEINMQFVANGYGDFIDNERKITLTTYHSSKGLDFDVVFIPFITEETTDDDMRKRLFMVAMTRSRKDLFLTFGASHMSSVLSGFASQCVKNWEETKVGESNNDDDDDFDFE